MATKGTLASIAAELGVSRTTVSNAYNHPDQLSPALREKILATAKARGYTGPDPMARSLRTRRVGAYGVMLTEQMSYAFEDHASIDFLAGLAESSYGTHNCLTLIPLGSGAAAGADPSPMVASAVVDGFVVYSVGQSEPHLDAARARNIPTVICDQPKDLDLPFVGIDDRAAIAPAARMLIDEGHSRIGILTKRLFRRRTNGPVSLPELKAADMHVQRDRVLGALDVFGEAGLNVDDIPVVTRHHNDYATALDGARELLSAHPDLTAVLCTTDSMAFGVLDYCAAQGIDVPGEISVTGFDGVEMAMARGLTTVIQPNKKKGATVGKLLHSLIDSHLSEPGNATAAERIILPTRFSRGRTVGPAAR
ncbi:substrate-binding domain-containing protein [Corynebacterium aquatimens]|uniref:DNA-binding LacI/PurR family transcriptional regulator n=1 Tax=Corynebacterium aquatimens TaxID=1190508 RepID=A0A931E1S8_9CORY|nr:DNA-binding LacI/PurR family transcriptional regulator [Corynebacterium aquatimens]